ncbi:MAG: SDR family oxidoreductase [Dongiaceae bacterium]
MNAKPGRQKIAFVTGGQGGIGRAINKCLVADGFVVVSADIVVDAAQDGQLDKTQSGQVYMKRMDVTAADSVAKAIDFAAGLGALRAVVNCAGILRASPIDNIREAETKLMVDINLFGTARVTSAAAPHLDDGAAIVNISSVSCRIPEIGYMSLYGASKAAIESYTRNTAKDLGVRGVRVNSIAPGFIDVDMSDDMRRLYEDPQSPTRRLALKRLGTAEEVAEVVAFLLSDRASYITGTNLLVDGGMTGY